MDVVVGPKRASLSWSRDRTCVALSCASRQSTTEACVGTAGRARGFGEDRTMQTTHLKGASAKRLSPFPLGARDICGSESCAYVVLEATVKKCVFVEDGFKCLRESIFSVFNSWICFHVNNIHWSSGNHILGEYVFPTQHLNSRPYMNQRICLGEDRFVYSF